MTQPVTGNAAHTQVHTAPCCEEYAALTRRGLLRGALALGGATTMVGSAVITASAASTAPAPAVLVVLSLRGAADGLSLVVPHADAAYYSARPTIAVPADRLLVKDAMFGLHPALEPLLPLWNGGRLAAVHATGLPAPNRSHFSAMEELEDAHPGSSTREGWLNRLIGTDAITSALQAFNLGDGVPPTSLYGDQPFMAAAKVTEMVIAGDDQYDTWGGRRASLHTLWDARTTAMGKAMRSIFEATTEFGPVLATADDTASYPDTDLGRAMAQVARLLRGDVGVEVVTVDHGNWDMHSDLGTVDSGRMVTNATELAGALAAFFNDLGTVADKVTLVAVSEFGRRVTENANVGLDHGYGNVMFLAGAGVKGGSYYGNWPGLTDQLDSDLLVTTDYRSVLAEVVRTRFSASTSVVFPNFVPETVGVMQGA